MLQFFRSWARRPPVEAAEASAALGTRAWPYVRETLAWVFSLVSAAGASLWSFGGSAWPSALAVGGVVLVALRVWWVAERRVGLLAGSPVALAPPSPGPGSSPEPPLPIADGSSGTAPAAGDPMAPAAGADAAFLREVAASIDELRGEVRRLDGRSDDQAIVQAVNAMVDNHNALARRIEEVARSASVAANGVGMVKAQLLPQIDKLGEDFEFFRKRFDRVERDLRERFGVRDADAALRELSGPIAGLSERLLRADRDSYPDTAAWRLELGEWQARVQQFWNIAERWGRTMNREWPPSCREVMEVSQADYAAVKGEPGPLVPADFSDQQLWRFVAVVSARHRRHAARVMGIVHDEATKGLHSRY